MSSQRKRICRCRSPPKRRFVDASRRHFGDGMERLGMGTTTGGDASTLAEKCQTVKEAKGGQPDSEALQPASIQ